jgi:predicted ATPase
VYSIEPAKLREMQDPDGGVSLRKDGRNAASVLQEIQRRSRDEIDRICEILATIVPNTRRVEVKKRGNKLALEFTQDWSAPTAGHGVSQGSVREGPDTERRLRFEAFNMSDGTLRALGLLAAVFQRPSPSLIAIEEPEATIHPGALGAVLDLIRHAAKTLQVVVTTHSPEVLDAEWIRPEHVRVVEWGEGATRVGNLSAATRDALRDHLMSAGELFRSNALHPEPLFEESSQLPQGDLFEALEG